MCTDLPIWLHHLPLPLQPASTHRRANIKSLEPNPDKLSLVFEPEAAAVACMELAKPACISTQSIGPPGPNDCYLTVDIGGGTIDITAHQVCEDGTLKILDIPHGRVYGGTEVNKKFEKFIGKEVFHDPTFNRYLQSITTNERKERCAELYGFVNHAFENAKKRFGSEKDYAKPIDGFYNFRIPPSLYNVYQIELKAIQAQKIEDDTHVSFKRTTQQLSISAIKVKEFFEDNVITT